MTTTSSTTSAVWNGHPSQYPMGQLPLVNPGQYASTQVMGSYVNQNFANNYGTVPATFSMSSGTTVTMPIPASTAVGRDNPVIEKVKPIKNTRAIDEPFVPSCEQ